MDQALKKVSELEVRCDSAEMSERAARKEHMDIKLMYDGGLTGE